MYGSHQLTVLCRCTALAKGRACQGVPSVLGNVVSYWLQCERYGASHLSCEHRTAAG